MNRAIVIAVIVGLILGITSLGALHACPAHGEKGHTGEGTVQKPK